MAVSDKLNENFVNELFKISLRNKRVFEVTSKYLKYQFLPNKHYKSIWKTMKDFNNVSHKVPTLGWLSQQFDYDKEVIGILADIRNAQSIDKNDALQQFEIFLKNAMFLEAYDNLGDLFNQGNKDEVFEAVSRLNKDLASFTIKDHFYDRVFEGILSRHSERLSNSDTKESSVKVPFGIDELDDISRGGVDKGDIALFLAGSGVGKSKLLKHIGITGARRGLRGLHIQAEGTRQETRDAYDAGITGVRLHDLEVGNVDSKTLSEIEKASNNIVQGGGEIFLEVFEQFDSADLQDVRDIIQDIIRTHGSLDFLILDYLELLDPGDGKRYKVSEERQRRESLINKLKNIAVEFNIAIFSATQAATVATNLLNDPEFVQTRYHVSEFKGVIKPVSYFITMNQTSDEKDNSFMRLYVDKCRKYRSGQIVKIFQSYDRERYYNRAKTLQELYTPKRK